MPIFNTNQTTHTSGDMMPLTPEEMREGLSIYQIGGIISASIFTLILVAALIILLRQRRQNKEPSAPVQKAGSEALKNEATKSYGKW